MSWNTKKYVSSLLALMLFAIPCVNADINQDRAEGIAWLLQNQNGDGSWGKGGARVAATSEALEALRNAGADKGFIYSRALSWLANAKTDSVDSLARKIIALENANFDTQAMEMVTDLLARRNTTLAWGSYDNYSSGFPDTSLAMQAIFATGMTYADTAAAITQIQQAQNPGDAGWTYMGGALGKYQTQQIMPTSYNLIMLSEYQLQGGNVAYFITRGVNWLINSKQQASDGSFLDNFAVTTGAVQKTALAYLALDAAKKANITSVASDNAMSSAQNFILSQQTLNGSWDDDAYHTALALRTFPSVNMSDTDGDGVPDAVEIEVGTNPNLSDVRNLIANNGLDPDGTQGSNLSASIIMLEVLQNQVFSYTPIPNGGTPAYIWSLNGGSLPDGITFQSASTGNIAGAPTSTGGYTFTLLLKDSVNASHFVPGNIRVIAASDTTTDTDGDGIASSTELANGSNPLSQDSDGDGIADGIDLFPLNANESFDFDIDGTGDNSDTDDDNDGISDNSDNCPKGALAWLSDATTDNDGDGCRDSDEDSDDDNDGLSDAYEISLGTDPKNADTDSDGLDDGDEITQGRNPLINEPVMITIINSILLD